MQETGVGAEMSGGKIHVRGEAGQQVGAAHRGSLAGMKGESSLSTALQVLKSACE